VWAPSWGHGRHGINGDRYVAAYNLGCPLDALVQLAGDDDRWVRSRVAKNLHTPPQVLARLAEAEDRQVRWLVGRNPNPPIGTLVMLAQLVGDDHRLVRQAVAKNPSTPLETLILLLTDADVDVRGAARANTHLPEEYRLLGKLAQ